MTQFKKGQTCYTQHNGRCIYVTDVPNGGHIVQVEIDCGDGDTHYNTIQVNEVFDKPFINKLEEDYSEVKAKISEAKQELQKISMEVWKATNERDRLLTRLQKETPLLQNLEHLINGEISHYVRTDSTGFVIGIQEASSLSRDCRFLVFQVNHGNKDRPLTWIFTGEEASWKHVIPCVSREQAVGVAEGLLTECLENHNSYPRKIDNIYDSYKRLGLVHPFDFLNIYNEQKKSQHLRNRKYLEEALNKAKKALDEANSLCVD